MRTWSGRVSSVLCGFCFLGCMAQGPGGGGGGSGGSGGSGGADGGGEPDGGDTGTSQLDIYAAGTRIKMRVVKTIDGATAFGGWYDSTLAIDCQITQTFEGKLRCLPITYGSTQGIENYLDSNCQTPVAIGGQFCGTVPAPKYISKALTQTCGYETHYYTVQTTTTVTTLWSKQSNGSCQSHTVPNYTVFTYGPE